MEHDIQNEIRAALSPYCIVFRSNVGAGVTASGQYFSTGLPKGYSDLHGHRISDGKAFYIEVKTPDGRVSEYQQKFINKMKASGAIAGVCRNVQDALNLIIGG